MVKLRDIWALDVKKASRVIIVKSEIENQHHGIIIEATCQTCVTVSPMSHPQASCKCA